jgi:hypothetical protein
MFGPATNIANSTTNTSALANVKHLNSFARKYYMCQLPSLMFVHHSIFRPPASSVSALSNFHTLIRDGPNPIDNPATDQVVSD